MINRKIKLLTLCVIATLFSSTQVVASAEEYNENTNVVEEVLDKTTYNAKDDIKIERNWLSEEVAKQLNKQVSELTVEDFKNITKVDLRYEKIDDEIPDEISYMENLQYLDLNYCKLYGSIPESIGNLPNLNHLDLEENELDEIPDNLLEKIKNNSYDYVSIEDNKFDIPEGWYTLKGKLCYLDRYNKRITGEQTIGKDNYIFDEYGNVKNGFDVVDGKTYYYDGTNGLLKSKWKSINSKWYYFDNDGVMLTGLQNINNVKYYFDENGVMLTGIQTIEGKKYSFDTSGKMQHGITNVNGNTYYFDEQTGEMLTNTEKTINGVKYVIKADGVLANDMWIDSNTYVKPDGQALKITDGFAHSNTNLNLFKYMTNKANRISVHYKAIELHDGDTANNCVFFTSESLRRIGINLAQSTCNTYDLENKLKNMGFVANYDLSQLKPGDIVFTNNYTHVYIFMYWDKNGYAYICDNQEDRFDNKILHLRQIYNDTDITDRATHFYYLPY